MGCLLLSEQVRVILQRQDLLMNIDGPL
jgi:hypothetical protein